MGVTHKYHNKSNNNDRYTTFEYDCEHNYFTRVSPTIKSINVDSTRNFSPNIFVKLNIHHPPHFLVLLTEHNKFNKIF